MAQERGYGVDVAGFERALEAQRVRSRAARDRTLPEVGSTDGLDDWTVLDEGAEQSFVGYDMRKQDTDLLAHRVDGDRASLVLRESPFYLEGGGQVSDLGEVAGIGWALTVDTVRQVEGCIAVSGPLSGSMPCGAPVSAAAAVAPDRHDTERNHTATHLLHSALRTVLGEHVVQRGSLVAPDRLRFDFAHGAPMTRVERDQVERQVNGAIWADHPVRIEYMARSRAVELGAMALFGEKYGDVVRTVRISGVSMELCGGTHVRHTGEVGLFKILSESGVAAGIRRVEAATGPGAFGYFLKVEARAAEAAAALRARPPCPLGPTRATASGRANSPQAVARGSTKGRRRRDNRARSDRRDGRRIIPLPSATPACARSR